MNQKNATSNSNRAYDSCHNLIQLLFTQYDCVALPDMKAVWDGCV